MPTINLSDLQVDKIEEAKRWFLAILSEKYPNLSFSSGVFSGFVIDPCSILAAALNKKIQILADSLSLEKLLQNLSGYDIETVDNLLLNFGVKRRHASFAEGVVYIILSASVSTTINANTLFETYTGISFFAKETVTAVPENPGPNEILLEPFGPYYRFPVPVKAIYPGSNGNVLKNTQFFCRTPISRLYNIVAASDFSGGSDEESPSEAAKRITISKSAAVLGNSYQLLNLIKLVGIQENISEFNHIVDVNIVGPNFLEMTRDQRTIFPISLGGKVDIYVKRDRLTTDIITAEALLIGITDEGDGVWRVNLTREQSEGVYRVLAVYPSSRISGDSFEITQIARDFDIEDVPYEFVPDIEEAKEAVFSCFQTISVIFIDDQTEVSPGEIGNRTQNYNLQIEYSPSVASLQSYLGSNDVRPPFLDILVKGCAPARLNLTITLSRRITADKERDIKAAIVSYVNKLPIGRTLYHSDIISSFVSLLPPDVSVKSISSSAVIQGFDDTYQTINSGSNAYLEIPTDYSKNISKNTVGWFSDESNITIS